VIAIENVRLLTELRERTDELGQSVGELRALGEVSQAVNSTLELQTVLSTIVAKAVQLSDTEAGSIYVHDETQHEFQLQANYGMSDELIAALKDHHVDISGAVAEAAKQGEPIQVPDMRAEPPGPAGPRQRADVARRLSRAAAGAAVALPRSHGRARGAAQVSGRIFQEYDRSLAYLRRPIGAGDPKRAAVPGNRRERPPARTGEP